MIDFKKNISPENAEHFLHFIQQEEIANEIINHLKNKYHQISKENIETNLYRYNSLISEIELCFEIVNSDFFQMRHGIFGISFDYKYNYIRIKTHFNRELRNKIKNLLNHYWRKKKIQTLKSNF